MRIGIRISPLADPFTGIPTYVFNTLKALSVLDSENEYFLYTNFPIPFELALGENFRTIIVSKPYPKWQLWYQLNLPFRLRRDGVDVYHDTLYLLPLLFPRKIPGIVTVYDLSGLVMRKFHNARVLLTSVWIPSSLKRARKIIAISEFTKNEILRLFPFAEGKIEVVLCGVSKNFTPASESQIADVRRKYHLPERFIMFVGTLEPRKNLENLLKAFSIVHKEIPHKLLIVGGKGWKYSNIFQKLEELKIAERVVFTGYVPLDDLPAMFSAAEIFVYPSLYEGFGLPILEAMATGCPVITSNVSSMPEVAGDSALFVDPLNVDDIAEKIKILSQNNELKQELSRKGIERAKLFSWEKAAKSMLEIFNKVAKEK